MHEKAKGLLRYICFLFTEESPEKVFAPQEVFRLMGKGLFEPVISTTVLAEIAKAPETVKARL